MRRTWIAVLLSVGLLSVARAGGVLSGDDPTLEPAVDRERVVDAYGRLPLAFEANVGQADHRVAFSARGAGYRLFLTPSEAVLALQPSAGAASAAALRLTPVGANPSAAVVGLEPLPGTTNYLVGDDPPAGTPACPPTPGSPRRKSGTAST